MRSNVLLIVLDTARADELEGPDAPPALAQLARRGLAVQGAHSTASWTLPSHASMFTGLLPRAVGLTHAPARTPGSCHGAMESQRDRLVAEVVRRAGYATAAASANLWVSPASGFDIGFDEFVSIGSGRQAALDKNNSRARLKWALEGVRAHVDDGAAEARQTLERWMDARSRSPFFWFVNLNECHSPYLPPRPYDDLPWHERLCAAQDARRYLTLASIWRACAGAFAVPEDALRRMRHLYRASIRYMDDWLAHVLDALDARGLLAETLVIVTSDHGENFGEGGLMAHAFSLDERLTRVPFVAAGPGAGALTGLRSLDQLPRLLADAIGLESHPWTDDERPGGVAVAQLDPSPATDAEGVARLAHRWNLGEEGVARMTTSQTCATDGRLKLLRRGDRDELYDLAADPLELSPQSANRNGAVAALRAALDHPSVWVESRFAAADASHDELAEIESRMRLLGYM